MRTIIVGLLIALPFLTFAQKPSQGILSPEVQIRIAEMAAPQEFRENSTVLGYNEDGEHVTLREGSNGYICLAPNYKTPTHFSAYCYPESLEPLMKRGREIEAMGKVKEKNDIRAKEYAEGRLVIPDGPTPLYVYWGTLENLNPDTGEMGDAKRRYVFYIPNAKAEDYGMSNKPNNLGMPWLMDEGTYKAHIMITPPHKH